MKEESHSSSSSSSPSSFLFHFLSLIFMALLFFQPEPKTQQPTRKKRVQKPDQKKTNHTPSSWGQIKNLLTCKQIEGSKVHDPSKNPNPNPNGSGYSKLSSCSSICSFRDVVHGNSRVVHRADNSPEGSTVGQETGLLTRKSGNGSSSSRSLSGSARSNGGQTYTSSSSKGMQLRKLSGCYECRMIVDPTRYPIPRSTICACPECGEVFPKIESMEHHQAIKHAVSELGPDDSGRNIVEIIFKSSWLKKNSPICKIERILKVHNTPRTIQRFEECRDAVKLRANTNTRRNPRCAADGNELLRFHCATLTCALGERGSSALCSDLSGCGVCSAVRHGFQAKPFAVADGGKGVRTTASSGRAHDKMDGWDGARAMLVCRVIAGRVRRVTGDPAAAEEENMSGGSYDSVAGYGYGGVYSNLEELYVFNPKAILPCFVVIYKAVEF